MKTFSRLLPAKPFRMGSNAQWKNTLVLFFGISNILLCCSIFPWLWTIANLKLLWYVFYSQTILHVQYEGIPLSIRNKWKYFWNFTKLPDGEIKLSIEKPIKISNKTKMSLVNHSSQQNVGAIKNLSFLIEYSVRAYLSCQFKVSFKTLMNRILLEKQGGTSWLDVS